MNTMVDQQTALGAMVDAGKTKVDGVEINVAGVETKVTQGDIQTVVSRVRTKLEGIESRIITNIKLLALTRLGAG